MPWAPGILPTQSGQALGYAQAAGSIGQSAAGNGMLNCPWQAAGHPSSCSGQWQGLQQVPDDAFQVVAPRNVHHQAPVLIWALVDLLRCAKELHPRHVHTHRPPDLHHILQRPGELQGWGQGVEAAASNMGSGGQGCCMPCLAGKQACQFEQVLQDKMIVCGAHSSDSPHLSHCLNLLQVAVHLIVQLCKPVCYPAQQLWC